MNPAKKIFAKQTVVAILFFILGSLIMYLYTKSQVEGFRTTTVGVLNNCVAALETSQDICQSCTKAYNTAATCLSNINSCNFQESKEKLAQYNNEKEDAQVRLGKIVEESGFLLKSAKQLQN